MDEQEEILSTRLDSYSLFHRELNKATRTGISMKEVKRHRDSEGHGSRSLSTQVADHYPELGYAKMPRGSP